MIGRSGLARVANALQTCVGLRSARSPRCRALVTRGGAVEQGRADHSRAQHSFDRGVARARGSGVSAIAIILLGIAFYIEGAEEGEETSGFRVIFDIAWLSYLLGAIAALALGIAARVIGRRRGERGTARAGTIALGWVVIAVLIAVIAGATD